MKKQILIFAASLMITASLTTSCQKKETPEPTKVAETTTPATVLPTIDVEFFISASTYNMRVMAASQYLSPAVLKGSKIFSSLGAGNVCTVTGEKLTFPYSRTDTTLCILDFFVNSTDQQPRETIEFKIDTAGNIFLSHYMLYSSGLPPPTSPSCKKAFVAE